MLKRRDVPEGLVLGLLERRAVGWRFSVARRSASWISTRSVEPHCGSAASFTASLSSRETSGQRPLNTLNRFRQNRAGLSR